MVLTFDLILLVLIRWCAEKKGKVPSAFRRQFVCSVFFAHAQGCVSVCVRCSTADSPVYWDHVEQVSFQDRDLNVRTHASFICNIFFNKCVCLSAVRRTYAVPVYKKKCLIVLGN